MLLHHSTILERRFSLFPLLQAHTVPNKKRQGGIIKQAREQFFMPFSFPGIVCIRTVTIIQTKSGDGSSAVQPERQAQGFRLFEQRFSPCVFNVFYPFLGVTHYISHNTTSLFIEASRGKAC